MKKFLIIILPFLGLGQDVEFNCTNISILQNDTTVCKGDSLELNAPSGYDYIWSTGDTSESIIVYPYETTVFSIQISSVGLDFDSINIDGICNTSDFLLGDVNYDQIINVQDIVLIVDLMLSGEYNPCGDVNCDQILNEDDVQIIEDFILGFGEIEGCVNCVDDILIVVETCGCLDPIACNYCSTCTIDDGSCWYMDECNNINTREEEKAKLLSTEYDFLGRPTSKKRMQLNIYSDGSVEKRCDFSW